MKALDILFAFCFLLVKLAPSAREMVQGHIQPECSKEPITNDSPQNRIKGRRSLCRRATIIGYILCCASRNWRSAVLPISSSFSSHRRVALVPTMPSKALSAGSSLAHHTLRV